MKKNLVQQAGALFPISGKQVPAFPDNMIFAEEHLRILSAFYGVIRPLEKIMPYRLEMMYRIPVDGKNFYQFWAEDLYREVYKKDQPVLNLASEEYAKCIRKYVGPVDIFVDVEFLVMRKGKMRTIATWAKMARGQMVRYIIKNRIEDYEQLKAFNWNGYTYEPALSYQNKMVFVR